MFTCHISLMTKIAATDYYMNFYLIVLFSLTAILKLINFTASYDLAIELFCFNTLSLHKFSVSLTLFSLCKHFFTVILVTLL